MPGPRSPPSPRTPASFPRPSTSRSAARRGLLEGVMDITGPHDSAADDDKWWDMVARLPEASERLDKMVEYSCRILGPHPPDPRHHPRCRRQRSLRRRPRSSTADRTAHQPDRAHPSPARRHAPTGIVGHRRRTALLRPHQPRALPPAHRRARLDSRTASALGHPPAADRTARHRRATFPPPSRGDVPGRRFVAIQNLD